MASKRFNENITLELARRSGLSIKAVRRILDTTKILEPTPKGQPKKYVEVGFSLDSIEFPTNVSDLHTAVVEALRDYQRLCPLILQWLSRGDFKGEKPPKEFNINRATIAHAGRTAGRLRAKIIRSLRLND